jgi:hypothetical protein
VLELDGIQYGHDATIKVDWRNGMHMHQLGGLRPMNMMHLRFWQGLVIMM